MKSTATNKTKKVRVIPGYHLTLGITVTMLSLIVLIPLASVMVSALKLRPAEFWSLITKPTVRHAFATSIGCSFIAALINSVFGVIIAWVLVRYEFPGKRILDGCIELPFALPTSVAGITLSKMYSENGILGTPLAKLGIKVSYTHLGLVIALVFVGIPFVIRAVQPVLEKLDGQYEEAAFMLGANRFQTFRRVLLPEMMPPVLTGFGLAFARGIGEYGSVIYISGNSAREHTQVISYVIMQKLGYIDYASATAIALVMLILSFLILLFVFMEQKKSTKYILIAISVLFIFVMLILPLFSILFSALKEGFAFYIQAVTTEYVRSALLVTLLATVIAVVVNTFFGIMAAWLLTKFSFRGKQVLATLIDIPFSISPVIVGLAFLMTFGRLGWTYPAIRAINQFFGTNIRITFALPGVVLATIFVTFPFVSREIIPILNAQGKDEEEAAALMGANGFTIFRKITLPQMKWGLIYGIILCTARALGEFGAVNALSKTRGQTFTLPLEIDALYMSGTDTSITSAFAVSSILVIIAVIVLILRNIFEYRSKNSKGIQ